MDKFAKTIETSLFSLFLFLALTAIFGAGIYRLHSLNYLGLGLLFSCLIGVSFILLKFWKKINNPSESFSWPKISRPDPLVYAYLALFAGQIILLAVSKAYQPIISPWQSINPIFFLIFLLSFFIIFLLAEKNSAWSLVLLSCQFLISLFVIVLVYPLGYGFDSFIHSASLDHISRYGLIEPKPFYYLGYYALAIFFQKVFFIPLALTNQFLVPILAALFLPFFYFRWLRLETLISGTSLAAAWLILLIPFSIFTHTTPQNLAFFFLLATLLLALSARSRRDQISLSLAALAALAIHPLSGLPAVFFAAVFLLKSSNWEKIEAWKKPLASSIIILNALAVPFIFFILGKSVSKGKNFDFTKIFSFDFNFSVPNSENVILNFTYLAGSYYPWLIFSLIVYGLYLYRKNLLVCNKKKLDYSAISDRKKNPIVSASVSAAISTNEAKKEPFAIGLALSFGLSTLLAYFLARGLDFSYLVDYEQSAFSARLLTNSLLFFLPFLALALADLGRRFSEQPKKIRVVISIFIGLLAVANLYLSYPRFDRYFNSRGFSVGQSDFDAVRWINENAQNDYIVLANQQVSAAALKEYGFKKYFPAKDQASGLENSEIFYYPIPTGGPLYQIYLDMVYDRPSRANAQKALKLTGASEAFFVLNRYWWAFDKLKREAAFEADEMFEIGDGEVAVFRYKK